MKKITAFMLLFTASFLVAHAQFTKIFDFDSTTGTSSTTLTTDGTFLYGETGSGGVNNQGIIYRINPDGTGFVKLHDFDGAANGPDGSLLFDGTFLYGVASYGGTNDNGSVFKVKSDGTGFVKLHQFTGTANGIRPIGSLITVDSFLYGMTYEGGVNDNGVIFKIGSDGTGFAKVVDISLNGTGPSGSLIFDGTFLYGMTAGGGGNGSGNVFKVMPDGTGFVTLHAFSGSDGGNPRGSLISDGTFLYGMTAGGNVNNQPVVFKVKKDGTGFAVLHDLGAAYEYYPYGDLLLDNGVLYGMTNVSGSDTSCYNGCGILFKINADGTGFTKLQDFSRANGGTPYGSLISDGTFLYGVLSYGGVNDRGTIFKYRDSTFTGIGEYTATTGFLSYPNPTSGTFTIEREKPQEVTEAVVIYNVMGEKVYKTTIRERSSLINLNVPDGIYFIHITTMQGIAIRKIVVRY